MRDKRGLLSIFCLCVLGVLLAFPAVAFAVPSSVAGTVTAAATGSKLAAIEILLHYRVGNSHTELSTTTDVNGAYSINFDLSEDATYAVRARDLTGVYDGMASTESTMAAGDTKHVAFALNKDTLGPEIELYSGRRMFFSAKAAGALAAAALPDGVERWAIMSDGTNNLEIEANDERYMNHRYFSWWDGSGIQSIGWAVNGGTWTFVAPLEATAASWSNDRPMWVRHQIPMLPEGAHSVSLRATDLNGNMRNRTELVVVDMSPPVTTYDRRTANKTRITLTPADNLSGVGATLRRTGTTGAFTYGTWVSVPSTGFKTEQFYSQDKLGNVEAIKTLKVSAPAKLSTPKPSTTSVSRTRTFKVTGSVYGRVRAKGYVRIYKLRNGIYRYVSRSAFTEDANGKYSVSLKLGPGAYKFRTSHGAYTATWANPPVLSAKSARVTVR